MPDAIQVLKPGWRALDANGDVYPGAELEFYVSGTSTPLTVYSDRNLSSSLGTSVTCDSGGYPTSNGNAKVEVYTGDAAYKIILKDEDGVTIWTHDGIIGALDTADFLTDGDVVPETPVTNTSSNQGPTTADKGKFYNINCSGGDVTVTVDNAADCGDGWFIKVRHDGTANQVLIVGTSSETFKIGGRAGVTAFALKNRGETAVITCDGTQFFAEQSSPGLFETTGVILIADRLATPPASPQAGARYIVTTGPSGAWSAFAEHSIAEANGQGGWFEIVPPTDCGWIAYVQDEDANYQFIASAWVAMLATTTEVAAGTSATKGISPLSLTGYAPGALLGLLEDRQTANTAGGSAVATTWTTRTLNTETYDRLGTLSLATNQFTISTAGTYEIEWEVPFFTGTGYARSRLYNITDSAEVESGTGAGWTGGTGATQFYSRGVARVTIAASKAFAIQYYASSTSVSLGSPVNLDSKQEIYTRVIVRRG